MGIGPHRDFRVGRAAGRGPEGTRLSAPLAVGLLLTLLWVWSPPIGVDSRARGDDPRATEPRPGASLVRPDGRIPTGAALADARAEFRRRHGRTTTRVQTATAAVAGAESLLDEAIGEPSATVRWVLFDEARKLGVAAGNAGIVGRAIRLASAEFDFDELALELGSLREIPLRALPPARAAELARAAEAVATRAESDGRDRMVLDSLALAVRAWQAAGDGVTARLAAERHDRKVAQVGDRSPPRPGGGPGGGARTPFRGDGGEKRGP